MKLIIIDPGFATDKGHHYPMNAFISHQARTMGYRSLVLGAQQYELALRNKLFRRPTFPCRFIFPMHGYEFPFSPKHKEIHSISLNMFCFGKNNVLTEEALNEHIPVSKLQDGDTILLHTAFISSLYGISKWLRKPDLPRVKVRIVLRFPPWIYQVNKEISTLLFQEILDAWEKIPAEVVFFTDVEIYTKFIQERTSRPVLTTPIGLDLDETISVTNPRGNKDTGLTFIAAGIPNPAKGSNLLPEAIEAHLQSFPQDRFIVQGNTDDPYFAFHKDGVPKPVFNHPNVQLLRKTLSTKDFHELLRQGDVILSPYCPIEYDFRTSHIFMEALVLNRVVIGGKFDWTEEWMEKLGNVGALLQEHNVPSLIAALQSVRENIEEHRQAVAKIKQTVLEENNAQRWLRFVLEAPR